MSLLNTARITGATGVQSLGKGLSGQHHTGKKHARFKHHLHFHDIAKYIYNNEKQKNSETNTRTPQKGHSNEHTHKHKKLQERRSDAWRRIIHRRKMQYNTLSNKRNQRKTTKKQRIATNMHWTHKRHSRYKHSHKNTDRTMNAIEPKP